MANVLGNEKLKELPTKINYSYFVNELPDCIGVRFYDSTKERLIKNEDLQKVSDNIMNALCYVYNESKRKDFNSNICNYLYYWLSDVLVTHLKHKSLYRQILGMLYSFLHLDNGKPICNKIDYTINENDIKKFKLIFDYSQDYNTYMKQLNDDSLKCTENYKNYLQNYVNSYKELQTECESEHNSYKYCDDFKTYISNKDPKHLSTRISKLEVTNEQAEQTKEGSSVDEVDTQSQTKFTAKLGSEGRHGPSDPHSDGRTTGVGITPAPLNDSPTPITSKSITAVASTAGFLVPSFLMYKFTPAGTWISKLLGRTPNIKHIPLRDSGIIEQFADAGRYNTENDRFNISYNPE